jgi:hypothetical protein
MQRTMTLGQQLLQSASTMSPEPLRFWYAIAEKRRACLPDPRLDALGDGIFAVAMTLLVLDLRLPENFHPQTSREFIDGLGELWPKFFSTKIQAIYRTKICKNTI